MICVECGSEIDSALDGSCAKCYMARTDVITLPQVLDLEFCAHCNSKRVQSHWYDLPKGFDLEEARYEAVVQNMQTHPELVVFDTIIGETQLDTKSYRTDVEVVGSLGSEDVRIKKELLVRTRNGVCDRCSRQMGGYWAALIQLRATDRDVTKRELAMAHKIVGDDLENALMGGNRTAFLQKEGPMHGGWDYYVGDIDATRNASKSLASRLHARVIETAKLVGKRDGRDMYRVTFLVRIHLFAPLDVALTDKGELIQYGGGFQGKAHGVRLTDFRRVKMKEDTLRRLGGPEDAELAVLVSESEDEIQVLHPYTMQTIDLRRPPNWTPPEDGVPVFQHDEEWYVLPRGPNSS